jgi:hypothetical protein
VAAYASVLGLIQSKKYDGQTPGNMEASLSRRGLREVGCQHWVAWTESNGLHFIYIYFIVLICHGMILFFLFDRDTLILMQGAY